MARPANPEVRGRIVSNGQKIIHDQGYHATGVQDITAAAGVPKGSFYNYFETKEAFGVEILESYWNEIETTHGPLLDDPSTPPLERVRAFFRALCDRHAGWGFELGCLIGNIALELGGQSEDTRLKLSELLRRWETPIVACLREAQERGEWPADRDARAWTAIIVEAFEGAVMRGKIEQNRNAYDRFEEIVLPRLLS